MNLITDSWIPVLNQDGSRATIKPAQLADPNVMELDLPRLDFQGAAYQLLIGLLQTTFAPADVDEWMDYYDNPPSEDDLQLAFDDVIHAFHVDGDDARFMQDLDTLESIESVRLVDNLFINAPGQNALDQNKDFFIKRDTINKLSLSMASLALFTFQINATQGGPGFRVSLRGSGPMTTLIRPDDTDSTLWNKLWWNVINREEWSYPDPDFSDGSVFPWLAETRVSDKTGEPIYRDEVHPLHIYWAMPRRIRLIIDTPSDEQSASALIDDVTGKHCQKVVRQFKTKNYGNNYEGDWSPHPFTPYIVDSKKADGVPISIKGQTSGITYMLWHLLTFTAKQEKTGFIRAMVIDHTNRIHEESSGRLSANRLWAFSYTIINKNKANGFYSKELPIYHIPSSQQTQLLETVLKLHELTDSIIKQLRNSIKYSWMSERQAKDSKGDMSMIDNMFWQRSEPLFFSAVEDAVNNGGKLTPMAAIDWLSKISKLTERLYEEQVLSSAVIKQRHMEQLNNLRAFLYGNKQLAAFRNRYKSTKENS